MTRLELLGERRHVEPDDVGAVALERPGDRLADAARGAGDERDLAVERPLPVELGNLAALADPGELSGDVGRARARGRSAGTSRSATREPGET